MPKPTAIPEYTLHKNFYKEWVASTDIMISEERRLQLTVTTTKTSRKLLVSRASVNEVSEDGRSSTHKMFTDFSIEVACTNPKRVTEKVVAEQHMALDFESIVLQAKTFYNIPLE